MSDNNVPPKNDDKGVMIAGIITVTVGIVLTVGVIITQAVKLLIALFA